MSKKNKGSSKKEKGKEKKAGKKNIKKAGAGKKKEAKKAAHKKAVPKPLSSKGKAKKSAQSAPSKKTKSLKAKPVVKAKSAAAKPLAKKSVKAPVKAKVTKVKTAPKKQPSKKPVSSAPAKAKPTPAAQKPTPVKSGGQKKESPAPKTEGPVQSIFTKAVKKTPEVLAVQNTLPVKSKEELSASKIASISSSITNPVRKPESYSIKPEKEPSGKFEMEFVIHASAEMLYEFLSTPSGLSEWFCDDLNIRNGIYTFIWDDQLMQARLLKTSELQLVRFQWVDKTDGSYFEFRIQKDDLTNDISLIITDFAETASERESAKLLWQSQIEKLRHVIGSIF